MAMWQEITFIVKREDDLDALPLLSGTQSIYVDVADPGSSGVGNPLRAFGYYTLLLKRADPTDPLNTIGRCAAHLWRVEI
jgi:hypothetical protein